MTPGGSRSYWGPRNDPRQALDPRPQEAPRHAQAREGLPGRCQPPLPQGQGGGPQGGSVQLSGPAQPQARLPPAVDHAHQRRRAPERDVVLAVHPRSPARRGRAGPQDPGGHRRPRRRHLPTLCRPRPRGAGGRLTRRRPSSTKTGAALKRRLFYLNSMTITSTHNRKLREIRKLRMRRRWRERSHRFVAEGEDLLAAADAAGWTALERFCAAGSGLDGVEVESKLLASASGIGSGTRTLAVYEERWAPEAVGPLCVYLHGVHDPGNVGAVLRSAEAFGASCVALGPGSADPFGPKAVRASMGAIFTVPVAKEGPLPGVKIALVTDWGLPLSELWPSTSDSPKSADIVLMVGSEREGLPEEVIEGADHVAHIPIHTNSLNAAMATTIAL